MPHPSSPRLHDYLDSSSLDPLATSIGDENVDPQTLTQSSPIKRPRSSPQKVMQIVEDISFSSPHGANRRRSREPNSLSRNVSYQNLSPWKIRVTVEAEPEEMGIGNSRNTTRTTKVPLREESLSTEFVNGRGRRSQAGLSGAKRHSTPVREARNFSKGRRQSVTDLDITVLGDDEDLNEWSPQKSKKKGRTRSKKAKAEQEQQAEPGKAPSNPVDGEEGLGVLEDPGFEIRPDSDTEQYIPSGGEVEEDSPELRKIDLNRVSVRSRSRPPKGHKGHQPRDDSNALQTVARPPTLVLETGAAIPRSAVNGYPTPTSSIQGGSDDAPNVACDPTEHHESFDTILESEGFTMIDLESLPSARHFVSPPSVQACEKAGQVGTPTNKSNNGTLHSSPPVSVNLPPISSSTRQSQLRSRPTAIPSYLSLPEGESDISSTVPSSPPVLAQATPAPLSDSARSRTRLTPEPCSSPRLPSPPRASAAISRPHIAEPHKSTPPRLARVVKAGIALQGVLSPRVSSVKAQAKSPGLAHGAPKERLDDLFDGFDSVTRRELRAGLRFGEELAKRQKSSSPADITKRAAKISSNKKTWRGETTVQHTPPTLPTNTSDMVEKRACPTSSTTTFIEAKRVKGVDSVEHTGLTTPFKAKSQVPQSTYLDTQGREREWQLEREAVSRQIQNANASQVIVIDSDNLDENVDDLDTSEILSRLDAEDGIDGADGVESSHVDETAGDIWLAEAEAHNSSQHQTDGTSPEVFSASDQERQRARAREVISRPRRSLIPSPWKRGEDIDGASTFMTNGDNSGLLWKQPRASTRFGAGAIKRQLQGSGDAFGSGSPKQDTPLILRQKWQNITPSPDFTSLGSTSTTDSSTQEEESRDQAAQVEEEVQEEKESQNAEYVEIHDLADESVCEVEAQTQDCTGEACSSDEDISTQEASSLPPQPMKVPVKFNDSTLSAPPLTPSFQLNTPQSSRPSTPRSALKGGRNYLGLEDNSGRKVAFSLESHCVNEDGEKSNTRIKSLSPTPPPSTIPGVVELLQPALPPPTLSRGIPEPEPEPEPAKVSWFGWLWSSSKVSFPNAAQPTSTELDPASIFACVDGAGDTAGTGGRKTKHKIKSKHHDSKVLPSFLRPPSYPSDPSRDASVPLATSGEFANVHFRTLHIIYRKSLRRGFHAPQAIRPRMQKMVGEKFSCDEGEYGHFAWEVDQDAVVVMERFMMEVELGWEGKGHVEWGWTEKELCHRLFRIIVGEEVRREQA